MADAKRCDRCKDYYTPFTNSEIVDMGKIDGRILEKITIHTYGMQRHLDICSKCSNEFRNWFGRDVTRLR